MTPLEKAKELIEHYKQIHDTDYEMEAYGMIPLMKKHELSECANICVDMIIKTLNGPQFQYKVKSEIDYWNEVKVEISTFEDRFTSL